MIFIELKLEIGRILCEIYCLATDFSLDDQINENL
jgi:hypothetical protein